MVARLRRRRIGRTRRVPNCRVVIDLPPAGTEISPGLVLVQGWATYGDGIPTSVRITVGDLVDVFTPLGDPRTDVALALGRDVRDCGFGWKIFLDLGRADFGPLVIGVEALAGGVVGAATRTVHVVRHAPPTLGPPVGAFGELTEPTDAESLRGTVLHVRGWCLFPSSRVARVEIELDGVAAGRARINHPSGEIVLRFQDVDASVSAFETFLVPEAGPEQTEIVVSAIARSLDGRTWHSEPTRVVVEARDVSSTDDRGALLATRTAGLLRAGTARKGNGVLVFTHQLSLGGGQLWLWDLVRQLHVDHGFRCKLVSELDGPLREELEDLGIEVQITQSSPVHSVDAYEGRVRELALLIEASGCQTVLLNTLGMFPAADAAQRSGFPTIWAIHESFDVSTFLYHSHGADRVAPHVRSRFEAALSDASALVFEARQTSELFAEFNTRRRVVDYGIDLSAVDAFQATFDRARARLDAGFDDDDTIILVMGIFEPRKSQALVMAAFDELAAVHPHLKLALVGAHPSTYQWALEEQVRRSGLGDRVRMVAVTPDIYAWYGLADLFLCASDVESLPRSLLEAMAFRLPIVTTDVWGIVDLIDDNETGWLTQPRDLERLIGTLHLVLSQDRERWATVAEAARRHIEECRGADHYARVFAEMIRRIAADADGDRPAAFLAPTVRGLTR